MVTVQPRGVKLRLDGVQDQGQRSGAIPARSGTKWHFFNLPGRGNPILGLIKGNFPGTFRKAGRPLQVVMKWCTAAPTGVKSAKAQMIAEAVLAIWNGQNSNSLIPATSGTVARKGPRKRPRKIAQVPKR